MHHDSWRGLAVDLAYGVSAMLAGVAGRSLLSSAPTKDVMRADALRFLAAGDYAGLSRLAGQGVCFTNKAEDQAQYCRCIKNLLHYKTNNYKDILKLFMNMEGRLDLYVYGELFNDIEREMLAGILVDMPDTSGHSTVPDVLVVEPEAPSAPNGERVGGSWIDKISNGAYYVLGVAATTPPPGLSIGY